MPNFFADTRVRDIVNQDFRAAALFETRGIDFCCGGGKTLAEACAAAGADGATVLLELASLGEPEPAAPRFASWEPDFLTKYIEANHHAYVLGAIETIRTHTRKVAEKHGANHPEVVEIARLFEGVAQELTHHMMKEEHILFPFIRDLAVQARAGRPLPPSPFGTVRNPIRMMEMEHESAGAAMRRIRDLSTQFAPPPDACATYRVSYQELQEFERDLHQHIHLENNILHPRAIALESGAGR
jgi:regulator of cell morphogenesis and NO signaling